jgi:hypothetical protein
MTMSTISGEWGVVCFEPRETCEVAYLGCPCCHADLDHWPVWHSEECPRFISEVAS